MWIIFGTKVETERVPNGARAERRCEKCGEVAMFYERRAVSKLQLYFLDVLDYASRRVMACGACGALYGTDEVGAPDAAFQLPGAAKDAAARVGEAAREGWGRLREAGGRALEELGGRPAEGARGPGPDAADATADPLADDDAALEAKFRELEKKYRVGD
jgi:hypothetical protein